MGPDAPVSTQHVVDYFDTPQSYLAANRLNIAVRAALVRDLLGTVAGESLLDVGAGDGSLSLPLLSPSSRFVLLDISAQMLEVARRNTSAHLRPQVEFVQADFLDFDPERRFDVVLCVGVLAHVRSVEDAVAKLAHSLKPGGRCVVQYTDVDQRLGRDSYERSARKRRAQQRYVTNAVSSTVVLQQCQIHGLQPVQLRQYGIPLRTFERWPWRCQLWFQRLTLRWPPLSRLGADKVWLMVKT